MKLLIVLAGGGFLFETESLLEKLDTSFDYYYVTGRDSAVLKSSYEESRFYLIPKTTSMSETSVLMKVKSVLASLFSSVKLVRKIKPDAIVCVGSSMSIPLYLAAKMLRFNKVKTVFIESITRTDAISKTGKILLKLKLVDRFYAQWPQLEDLSRRIVYKGTIL